MEPYDADCRGPSRVPSLVVVGAGPRGTGFLERVAANAPSLYGGRRLDIHLVDPYPPGGGRNWHCAQSPLLWMNSVAQDVTMYTDDSVPMDGPVRHGPTLYEWARDIHSGRARLPAGIERPESAGVARALRAELGALAPQDFAGRRVQGAYLRWVYEQAVASMPPGISVHWHPTTAVRVMEPGQGRQSVRLAGRREPLPADALVLALGHLEGELNTEHAQLRAFADRHDLLFLPPGFTAETDLSGLPAGEPVIARGIGLAFVDLMALVTEGRGGHYSGSLQDDEDELIYHPSGKEPVLHVGSRRGVPYHPKAGYDLTGEWPPLPRFLGPAQADELLNRPTPPDHRRDVRPLIGKELGFAHYHFLFTRRPERTRGGWTGFEHRYAVAGPGSPEMEALLATAVPDPADRFSLEAVDSPLSGLRLPSHDALQDHLRDYIRADLGRTHDPAGNPGIPVYMGLLSLARQLVRLGEAGDPDGSWFGLLSSYACGPPSPRLRQLLALSRAGVVRFLGPGMTVEADEGRGIFRAGSPSVPGAHVTARALVEARLPTPPPERVSNPLLRNLYEGGAVTTSGAGLVRVGDDDGRLLTRHGGSHPRRFALGPFTTARTSAFAPPHSGGPAFRQNDAAARAALALLIA